MYVEGPIIPLDHVEHENGNRGRYHKPRHRHNQTSVSASCHESRYTNHRSAPDFRDETAGPAAWLLDILFKDAPLAYSTLAPASWAPTERTSPFTWSLSVVAPREGFPDGDSWQACSFLNKERGRGGGGPRLTP